VQELGKSPQSQSGTLTLKSSRFFLIIKDGFYNYSMSRGVAGSGEGDSVYTVLPFLFTPATFLSDHRTPDKQINSGN
jgi:hypothetical protein